MASTKNLKQATTASVIKDTLEVLKENDLIDNFDENEEYIKMELKTAAQTEENLMTEMKHMVGEKSVEDIEKKMAEIIGEDRVHVIKKSLTIETYRMKLIKSKKNQQWVVQFRRGENDFRSEISMESIGEVELATWYQWASIVAEVFMLILSCAGITVDLSTSEMMIVTNQLSKFVKDSAFMSALNEFKSLWSQGGKWVRAKAIFFLLKKTYALGICWKIIKILFKTMSIWGEMKAIVECGVMLVAAFATEGIALIARIVLSVDSAFTMIQKMLNIDNFAEVQKTLE